MPLIIAGDGRVKKNLEQIAAELGANVTFTGTVSEEQKRTLFAEASCFIFAAEDDFGIAPVESLAAGTPVIGFGRGGLTETVQHGKSGILYSEKTVESLVHALNEFKQNGVLWNAQEISNSSLKFSAEAFTDAIKAFVSSHA